jgi:hypothetical protein
MLDNLRHALSEDYPLEIEALWFTTPDWLACDQYVQRSYRSGDTMYDFWKREALEKAKRFWSTAIQLRELIPIIWEIDPRQGMLGPPALRLALPE